MKRILSVLLICALLLTVSACRKTPIDNISSAQSEAYSSDLIDNSDAASQIESEVNSQEVTTEPSNTSSEINSNKQPSTSQVQSSANAQSTVATKTKPNFGKLPRCILDLANQVPYYSYDLPGVIVDYVVDGDLIYMVFRNQNLINVYNGNTGAVAYSYSLPARPAELHMYGNELWISYPELKCINVYNKADFKISKSIMLNNEVYSFDVYKESVFYAGEKRKQFLYKYDITTQSTERLAINSDEMNGDFYEPAILVDANATALYIAETNLTACKLYVYNVETLEHKGTFERTPGSSYSSGFGNYVRKMLLLDGFVYWNNFKFNPSVFWKAEQYYGSENGGDGILFVDSDYVATLAGVYDNKTGKKVVSFQLPYIQNNKTSKFAITKSKNIMYAQDQRMYIFYG